MSSVLAAYYVCRVSLQALYLSNPGYYYLAFDFIIEVSILLFLIPRLFSLLSFDFLCSEIYLGVILPKL
jgi:hypothetical protein